MTFRCFPDRIPPARSVEERPNGSSVIETEPGIRLVLAAAGDRPASPENIVVVVLDSEDGNEMPGWLTESRRVRGAVYLFHPRGTGQTRWTRKNPPNYVERSFALLGRTADTARVWDIVAAARFLREKNPDVPLWVAGRGGKGVLAAYAALWEEDIAGVHLREPPAGHMDPAAPQFLNVLRVCDIPEVLGMLAPRPVFLENPPPALADRFTAIRKAVSP